MEKRLGRLLAMSAKVAREHFDADLGEVGSSLNTFVLLRHAHLLPGVSQRQLAQQLGIEGPTLTHHLDRLVAQGLVHRVRSREDRRVWSVELTDVGRAHLDRVEAHANRLDAEFRGLFSEHEVDVLFTCLNRIRDHYRKEADVFDSH
jgi:MarR family transcriptional regulator for hemolysin